MKTVIVILIVLGVFDAAAAVVAQCEIAGGDVATDGEGHVLAWYTLRDGEPLIPALLDSPAWGFPSLEPDGIAFGATNYSVSPLAFVSNVVSTLFLVVTPPVDAREYGTLIEVPGAAVTVAPRATPMTYDLEDAAGLCVRINGRSSLVLPAGPHIVEVDFPQPVPGGDLRVGGASVCAEWWQQWRGRIGTVIAFDAQPDDSVRRAVRCCLARRCGVADDFSSPGRSAVLQAQSQGFDTHGLFSTRLFFK